PDFVIIDCSGVKLAASFNEAIVKIIEATLDQIDTAYSKFVNQCKFEQIVGYMSVKRSLAPDRRLQIAHEGSLMKALYTHLQTRQWILNPPGIVYYGIAAKVGKADLRALKTVATASIVTVQSKPLRAVDALLAIDSIAQADEAFVKIL